MVLLIIFGHMPKSKEKYLIGLVTPEILSAIEADKMDPVFLDLQSCNALEIRYDFFDVKDWPKVAGRLRRVAPHAIQIGTIRLIRDGGKFSDNLANARIPLWRGILEAADAPQWLDLEQDCLYDYEELNKMAYMRRSKILISQHNFMRIPTMQELRDFARDALRLKAPGLKIAAMSNDENDCDRLYEFIRECSSDFDFFAAFGMGEFGKISRIWSLKEGANLTYGCIGNASAPGQLSVPVTKKILDNFENLNSKYEISSFLG